MERRQQGPRGGITPHITIRDRRAAEAIDWYKRAFGAEELMRHPTDDGRLMHARLEINGGSLMLHDDFPEHMGGRQIHRRASFSTSRSPMQTRRGSARSMPGPVSGSSFQTSSGATATGRSPTRSGSSGALARRSRNYGQLNPRVQRQS